MNDNRNIEVVVSPSRDLSRLNSIRRQIRESARRNRYNPDNDPVLKDFNEKLEMSTKIKCAKRI